MSDMLVALYRLPEQDKELDELRQKGIVIRKPLAPEKQVVLDWVKSHFSKAWADECDVSFSRQPVACYIAIEHGKLIGFACYEATCRNFSARQGSANKRGDVE